MNPTDDTVTSVPPIIAGGVYEFRRPSGAADHALCVNRIEGADGKIRGVFRRFGYADERLMENGEDLAAWTLVSRPYSEEEINTLIERAVQEAVSNLSPMTGKPKRKYTRRMDKGSENGSAE